MKDIFEWFVKHWPELFGSLTLGGGGAFGVKKLTDKKQDAKIKQLENKVGDMEKEVTQLKNDISVNTMFDKQFREQVEREYTGIKEGMKEIKESLQLLTNHLLNKSK